MPKLSNRKNAQVTKVKTQNAFTGYHLFYGDERKKIDNSTVTSKINSGKIGKHIGAKWRALDITTRSLYEIAAIEKKFQLKGTSSKENEYSEDATIMSGTSMWTREDYYVEQTRHAVYNCSATSKEVSRKSAETADIPSEYTTCYNIIHSNAESEERMNRIWEEFSPQERISRSILKTASYLDNDFIDFVLSLNFA